MVQRLHAAAALAALVLSAALSPRALAGGARLYKSGPIQSTADGQWVWVVNTDSDSVSRIEVATDAVTEIPLPDPGDTHRPLGLSVREDGAEVWVACHDSDRVYVLAPDGSLIRRIDLPWGSGPHSLALSRDQRFVLVSLHRAESLALLDASTHSVSRILAPTFPSPLGITWIEDGVTAWVTHLFADGEDPHVTRVDVSGPVPRVKSNLLAGSTNPKKSSLMPAGSPLAEGGYLTFRGHLAQIPSAFRADRLWIPTQYNNINEDVFTPDTTIQSTIRTMVLSTRQIPNTNADKIILSAVHVHDPQSTNGATYVGPGWDAHVSGPVDIGFRDDGAKAYILFEQSNDLVVMDSATPAWNGTGAPPLPEIRLGARPLGLTVLPTADVAYAWNSLDATVSVVDLAGLAELRRLTVSSPPFGGGPLLNGARLFHSSDDPRISINEKISCASCHPHGEHDGRTWDFENLPGNHGPRSSMSLLGLNLTMGPPDPASGFGQLHRSGDRDEIQDFEHTFQGVSMLGTGFLGAGVRPELGVAPNAGLDSDLDDIAAYVLSLPPIWRSPYRVAAGGLSPAALRGATFFKGSDPGHAADSACATCHVPATGFVDFKFHDVGQRRATNENELNQRGAAWNWKVNTPTLVGAFASAPYDGVTTYASTMLDVLQDLSGRSTHGTPGGLTRRQLRDLAEFVLSVDGNMTDAEVQAAADTEPPRIARVAVTSLTRIEVWFDEGVEAAAASPSNWRVREVGGADVPITAGTWDAQNGDRITLTLDQLQRGCTPITYELVPVGAVGDLAATASGGTTNYLDPLDPANTATFSVDDTITITLGASGYENLTIRVHDASTIGSGYSNGGHGSPWLNVSTSGVPNTGFVRFDWAAAFQAATGITLGTDIVAASISIVPEMGDVQTVEAKRCLLSWSDIGHTDWAYDRSRGIIGAPTWSEHVEGATDGQNPWNAPNAGRSAAGVEGRVVADYDGANDTAFTADATLAMDAINEPFTITGPMVTDAFRFWLENPAVDYGYVLRVVTSSPFTQRFWSVKFARSENRLQLDSPVLTVTYSVPMTVSAAPPEVSAAAAPEPLHVVKDPAGLRISFEDLGAQAPSYSLYEGTIGSWYSHGGVDCGVLPAPAAGRRDLTRAPVPEDAYFLVTAANPCAEGISGEDSRRGAHPPAFLDCPP